MKHPVKNFVSKHDTIISRHDTVISRLDTTVSRHTTKPYISIQTLVSRLKRDMVTYCIRAWHLSRTHEKAMSDIV